MRPSVDNTRSVGAFCLETYLPVIWCVMLNAAGRCVEDFRVLGTQIYGNCGFSVVIQLNKIV